MAPLILKLDSKYRRINFELRQLYPLGMSRRYPLRMAMSGSSAGLDASGKRKSCCFCWGSNNGYSVVQPIA
jgi:hypothetical protein